MKLWCWDGMKQWQKQAFRDGLDANIDLEGLNKVDKCRDEIKFCRDFINLGTYLHNSWGEFFLQTY
jgi:hypothetical protein